MQPSVADPRAMPCAEGNVKFNTDKEQAPGGPREEVIRQWGSVKWPRQDSGRFQLKQRLATRTEECTKPKEGQQRQPARTPASWIVLGREWEGEANCGCRESSATSIRNVVGSSPGIPSAAAVKFNTAES
jgi:hypothetical protein